MNSSTSQPESQGQTVLGVVSLLIALTSLSIVLRIWSRIVTDSRFWWDDWLALAALPAFLGAASVIIIWVNTAGLGEHASTLSPSQTIQQFKLLFVYYWFYNFGLTLPKLSVLCFYSRIFKAYPARWLRIALWVTATLVILRLIEGIVTSVIQCMPLEKIWDSSVPGRCVNEDQSYIVSGILDASPDVLILLLPLPIVWRLQSRTSKKIAITVLFACGSSVVALSLLLLIYSASGGSAWREDFSWNMVPRIYITLIEVAVSIIGVCLPAIMMLVKRAKTDGIAKLFTNKLDVEEPHESRSGSLMAGSQLGQFERIQTPSVRGKPESIVEETEYERTVKMETLRINASIQTA